MYNGMTLGQIMDSGPQRSDTPSTGPMPDYDPPGRFPGFPGGFPGRPNFPGFPGRGFHRGFGRRMNAPWAGGQLDQFLVPGQPGWPTGAY